MAIEKPTLKQVSIIGFGRFGQVLSQLLNHNFEVSVYDERVSSSSDKVNFVSREKALKSKTIFMAVPISAFSDLIQKISSSISEGSTVIDVCSVKMHPVKVMQEFLPENIDIIATHPMFGPDSFKENCDLKMVMHKVRNNYQQYEFWKAYFENQKINIIEMTPEAHDKAAAFSQGVTHYVGRILEAMNLSSTLIDTVGFKKLLSVKEQTCNDTWQLYCDLQKYNPYSEDMHKKLEAAITALSKKCP